ncbi:hypothetical protein [Microbispora sp. NPDC046933]|uniref:hypothetical protein n=1 Tax=Microbispora sp. NPDC046933 TaxID=3155618 RepID=UPI0033FB22B6
MEVDNFPDWMREFRDPPPSWTPPEELTVPTPVPSLNLALSILASPTVGNDLIELVGSWISAMARLNMWYKDPGRRPLREGEYPRLLVLPGNVAGTIYEFWQAYLRTLENPSAECGDREYQALLDAVRDGTQVIHAAMA